jgi:hypothetical protein
LKAAEFVVRSYPKVVFFTVGDGELMDELKTLKRGWKLLSTLFLWGGDVISLKFFF